MTTDGDDRGVSDGWARRRARVAFEIERAALHLFATRSPDEVTVEDIAQAAGISRRTFFRYFPSRDDVLAALPMRHVHRLCVRWKARPAHEGFLDAFIAAIIEEDAEGDQDDMILLWGRAVLPAFPPEEERIVTTMVDAYGAVIAARTGLHVDDARVQVWATAIASISGWAFLRWLEVGGNRSQILVDALGVLGELGDATNGSVSKPTPAGRKALVSRASGSRAEAAPANGAKSSSGGATRKASKRAPAPKSSKR
ncbi:MAG TPA: TetR family transcriptional regulator [Acidimicrobiales bacterium]|jgi:AcrR family transcriptional regulator